MREKDILNEKKTGRSNNLNLLGKLMILSFFALLSFVEVCSAAEWPTKGITLNCTTAAGGGVDMAARAFAPEISKILGVPITVINLPGGGGGICAQNTYMAPNDGYTWQAQGAQLRVMGVLGYHDKSPKEWYCIPLYGYTAAIIVRSDSPYKTFPDLVDAIKKNPNMPASASYPSTSWAINYELMKKVTGLGGRYVPYSGTPPTHVGLLTGDIVWAMTGVAEHASLLKGGKVRALAHFDDKPYKVEGYGEIPAITDFLPTLKSYLPLPAWNSLSLRVDTPKPILKKIDEAVLKAAETKSVKEFGELNYMYPMKTVGDAAQKLFLRQASIETWILFDAGVAKKSPAEFGIPKP
jgi:tripartite-type tricarboxylate transporter receptor subunit TctC